MDIEYLVTALKDITSKKKLVCINYEPAFALYNGELRKYNITENSIISQEIYSEIKVALDKRSLARAYNLVKVKDYTMAEMRRKLQLSYYPEESIEKCIQKLIENRFLDDERYTDNYVTAKISSKSKKYIKAKLFEKGIDSQIVDRIIMEKFEENEDIQLEGLTKLINKKLKNTSINDLNYEDKQKLLAYLYRKGFSSNEIKKTFAYLSEL